MKTSLLPSVCLAFAVLFAPASVGAWSLFGGPSAEEKLLERADAAFESAMAAAEEGRTTDELQALYSARSAYQKLADEHPAFKPEHVTQRVNAVATLVADVSAGLESGALTVPDPGTAGVPEPGAGGTTDAQAPTGEVFRHPIPVLVQTDAASAVPAEPEPAPEPAPVEDPSLSATIPNPFYKGPAPVVAVEEPAPVVAESPAPAEPVEAVVEAPSPADSVAAPAEPAAAVVEAPAPAPVAPVAAAAEAPAPAPAAPVPAPAVSAPESPSASVVVKLHEPSSRLSSAEARRRAHVYLDMIRSAQAPDAVVLIEDELAEQGDNASLTTRLLYVRALVQCRNYERAADVLAELPKDVEDDPAVRSMRAAVAVGLDKFPEALLQLSLLLQDHPDYADAYIDLAYVNLLLDPAHNRDSSISYYKIGLEAGAKRDPRLETELGIRIGAN